MRRAVAALLALAAGAACDPGPVHRWADGRVVARGHVERHDHTGPWTLFDERGRRVATGCFARGQPTGIWKTFAPDTGTLKERHTFVNGVLAGAAASWHADGRLAAAGAFAAGLRVGPWTFWHASGEVDLERTGCYRGGVRVP
jgi:antitoxin component YwqK of YwqJK toxin-antitoxin module